MNEDIRKMIDKVKNFKQFVNEQQETETNINNNFRKWFSGSKVVYNGKPLPVYHGSPEEFDSFIGDTYFTLDYFNADRSRKCT